MIKKIYTTFALMVAFVTLVSCGFAAEFSAVLTGVAGQDKPQEVGKLYVSGKKVRCEVKSQQGKIIQIRSNKKMWIINPAVKEYIEMPEQKVSIDFYITSKDAKNRKGIKFVGVDTYDGYVCDKYSFASTDDKAGKVSTTIWISRELDAAIKISSKTSSGNPVITFKVRNGKQKKSLFELPKGYKKITPKLQQRPMGR